jgi:hypothetical protein
MTSGDHEPCLLVAAYPIRHGDLPLYEILRQNRQATPPLLAAIECAWPGQKSQVRTSGDHEPCLLVAAYPIRHGDFLPDPERATGPDLAALERLAGDELSKRMYVDAVRFGSGRGKDVKPSCAVNPAHIYPLDILSHMTSGDHEPCLLVAAYPI